MKQFYPFLLAINLIISNAYCSYKLYQNEEEAGYANRLHLALSNFDSKKLKELIENDHSIYVTGWLGRPVSNLLLFLADAKYFNKDSKVQDVIAVCKLFLEKGININGREYIDHDNKTVLEKFVLLSKSMPNAVPVIKFLLENGADPLASRPTYCTAQDISDSNFKNSYLQWDEISHEFQEKQREEFSKCLPNIPTDLIHFASGYLGDEGPKIINLKETIKNSLNVMPVQVRYQIFKYLVEKMQPYKELDIKEEA